MDVKKIVFALLVAIPTNISLRSKVLRTAFSYRLPFSPKLRVFGIPTSGRAEDRSRHMINWLSNKENPTFAQSSWLWLRLT